MEPRVATGRNSSRAVLILCSISAETTSLWFTSWAVTLVSCSTLSRSSSSMSEPLVDVSRNSRLSSSCWMSRLFSMTDSNRLTRSASSSERSADTTRASSWSSSPFCVTVKSIMVTLELTSGVYAGFGSFVVM